MQYSKPCQILVDEHDVILSVIEAVESVARTPDVPCFGHDFFQKACNFFANFADKYHHGKEEAHLFPMLEERGIPRQGGPIGCMLHDHEQGRSHVHGMEQALTALAQGDASAGKTLALQALRFCELLRQHIQKENQVLFVVGDQAMSETDKNQLLERFGSAERELLPPGTASHYTMMAEELRTTAGLGPALPGLSRQQPMGGCSHHSA